MPSKISRTTVESRGCCNVEPSVGFQPHNARHPPTQVLVPRFKELKEEEEQITKKYMEVSAGRSSLLAAAVLCFIARLPKVKGGTNHIILRLHHTCTHADLYERPH